MTHIEHAIEQIRQAMQDAMNTYGPFSGTDQARHIYDYLHALGLLTPSPLREEWGVDCYLGFEPEAYLERRNAEKHLAYEGGSLLHRYVTDWGQA